jgi:hypothetical protein
MKFKVVRNEYDRETYRAYTAATRLQQPSSRSGPPQACRKENWKKMLCGRHATFQKRAAAGLITGFTVAFNLSYVATHSAPAPDLTRILFRHSPAHIVAAIPLEPAARIVGMDPTLFAPHGKRLTCIHAKIIKRAVTGVRRQLGAYEPLSREFLPRIRHVFSAKHPKLQHFLGRKLRAKLRWETSARRSHPFVLVPSLHAIVDNNGLTSSSCHLANSLVSRPMKTFFYRIQ